MEATIEDRFALVQDDYELENWQVAAELLTEIVGVRAVSARQRTRDYAEALGNLAPDALVDTMARVEGFRLLIMAIVSRSTQAYVSPGSAALLTALPVRIVRSPPPVNLNDFDAFNRWLLQRLRQGARVAGGGLQ
jgi:hypothetical protein